MKNTKTILAITVGSMMTLGMAMTTSIANAQPVARFEGTTAIVPNAGNALERELTPALREQGRKKVILENKKLDLEIEKVDFELLKVQQESLEISNPTQGNSGMFAGVGGSMAPKFVDPTKMDNKPLSFPQPTQMPVYETKAPVIPANLSGEAGDESDASIRVLMITGNDGNLKAKIMHNSQGGYVVGQGDILPNGKRVIAVTPQYLEVTPPNSKKRSEQTKIYVSGYPSSSATGAPAPTVNRGAAAAIDTPFGIPLSGIPMRSTRSQNQ